MNRHYNYFSSRQDAEEAMKMCVNLGWTLSYIVFNGLGYRIIRK